MVRSVTLLALCCLLPRLAVGQATTDGARIDAIVNRITPALIELRHDLHRNPELSNRETRTAGVIARELRRLGLEVREGIAHTGVVGILRGGLPGPVVGVRADM